MKKWKYLTMTAVLGSALLLGACGDDEDKESSTAKVQKHKKKAQHNYQEMY